MENTTNTVTQTTTEQDESISKCVNTILDADTHMIMNSRIVRGINTFMTESEEVFQRYNTGTIDEWIATLNTDIHRILGILKGSRNTLAVKVTITSKARDLYEHYMQLNQWIKIHRPVLLESELNSCAEKQDFIMDYTPDEHSYYSSYTKTVIERYLALYQVQYTRLFEIDHYVRIICETIKGL